jgi:hypothetical protein
MMRLSVNDSSQASVVAYLLDYRQQPRLRIVVAIRTDAQVDLLVGLVFAVGSHEAEQRIFGGL